MEPGEGLPATSRWPPRRGFTPGAERRPRQLTAPAGDRVWCWSRLRTTRIDEQSTVASPSARDGSHRHLHLRVRLERLPRGHRPRHHRGHEDRSKGHCADTSLPDSATSGCCSYLLSSSHSSPCLPFSPPSRDGLSLA